MIEQNLHSYNKKMNLPKFLVYNSISSYVNNSENLITTSLIKGKEIIIKISNINNSENLTSLMIIKYLLLLKNRYY